VVGRGVGVGGHGLGKVVFAGQGGRWAVGVLKGTHGALNVNARDLACWQLIMLVAAWWGESNEAPG
jgi:hypothetical protein